jgi:alpha-mannosidase
MKHFLAFLLLYAAPLTGSAEANIIWQIGRADTNTAEFALAPGNYSAYLDDPVYLVGYSAPSKNWPYVHPGPADDWAGSRPHAFTILFNLTELPTQGEGRLVLRLIGTHQVLPPRLAIAINNTTIIRDTIPGRSADAPISGHLSPSDAQEIAVPVAVAQLRKGENIFTISNIRGSWALYDAVWLELPAGAALGKVASFTRVSDIRSVRALVNRNGKNYHLITGAVTHSGEAVTGTLHVTGGQPQTLHLKDGRWPVESLVPAVTGATPVEVRLEVPGRATQVQNVTLRKVPELTVYIVPHSHTDIGFTALQPEIETKQVNNLLKGIECAQATATNPPGSRFVWNVEVAWAADLYMQRMTDEQRQLFCDALRKGQVALNGMYLNELSGLCRPAELLRLYRYGPELAEENGVTIDTAMISDVPGHTWGNIAAMRQAGIKYFSTAPNYFDRIGTILAEWENKPFYWVAPDGKSEVLVWIPWWGYALSHRVKRLTTGLIENYMDALEHRKYPYEIAYLRWSGIEGDNAAPDPNICDFVKQWNATYAWPHLIISSQHDPFAALEQRYGKDIPRVRGDWTPYWEDGAGSSAFETAMNRESSDRLAQAEALWAMFTPSTYPARDFENAWDHVLLYSEHTWGAWCSITQPESQQTKEQWKIKRSYALKADELSRDLLKRALALAPQTGSKIEVLNTASWSRTDLVTAPKETKGNVVIDDTGKTVPSQRLSNGALVFLANDVPAFGAKQFSVAQGTANEKTGSLFCDAASISNSLVSVKLDPKTGGIVELVDKSNGVNYADTSSGHALNDYLYYTGDNWRTPQSSGPVTIRIGEQGPLVASLLVESDAPGCKKLTREIRLRAGAAYVEVFNCVDKARLEAKSYAVPSGKESGNFAYAFNVPDGQVRWDVPFGVVRPNEDQIPSACKNWLTLSRWADVSAGNRGITLVSLDAPLLQLGTLTANLLGSQTNPAVWRKAISPTQQLYIWAFNNHWNTNYRAYQEGPLMYRFVLRPHGAFDAAAATRFATGFSQPLLVRSSSSAASSLLQVLPAGVVVSSLRPSDDGKAIMVTLFNSTGNDVEAQLQWREPGPKVVSLSGTDQHAGTPVPSSLKIPAWGVVTVRAQ